MRRSLTHYWRIHLAVILGVMTATTVLTGALLVGDSVRGSLRDLSLGRLGRIDHALVSERFVREDLAEDLASNAAFVAAFTEAAPFVTLGGAAVHAESGSRASRVQIQGIDDRFAKLFDVSAPEFTRKGPFAPVVLNATLAEELGAAVGDAVLLSFAVPSDIHRESLFGREDVADALQTLRLSVSQIIPDQGLGRFGLRPHQGVTRNAFVSLAAFQRALGQAGRVNGIVVSGSPNESAALADVLSDVAGLDDLGLVLRAGGDYVSVESVSFLLQKRLGETIGQAAESIGERYLRVFTNLATRMQVGDRQVPYSTVAALNPGAPGTLTLTDGSSVTSIPAYGILLNTWTAEDLGAQVGDALSLAYYEVGQGDALLERQATFEVTGIVRMEGLGADRDLAPDYPGLQDARDMAAWDAPFPVDLGKVREKDEAYWDAFGATPKAFISEAAGRRLWKSRFGVLTSIRVTTEGVGVEKTAALLERDLRDRVSPESAGLSFQPVKQQGLDASTGATDFSGLFIGFSQFLIVSAALLVGLLFRLGVEQRAPEVGTLSAVGFTTRAIRRRFLVEGAALALVGAVLGVAGGAAYAWLMMAGLRTWWVAAVGTSELFLHVSGASLGMGFVISVLVVLFAIRRTTRRLGDVSVRALMSGETEGPGAPGASRARWYAGVSLVLAIGCLGAAATMDATQATGMFFGSGALILVAGLGLLAIWLRRQRPGTPEGIGGMGMRNTARRPGRSLLCASLIGSACFVIVAVGANRRTEASDTHTASAGTGGYALVGETDAPVFHDLNTPSGRYELGLADLGNATVNALRLLPGEDVSCLNLYQPERPRVLGVPRTVTRRGGFAFQERLEEVDDPWSLLEWDFGEGIVPAVGDYNSVMWILHKSLGDDIVIENAAGETVRLRLVALLKSSIFQSELLISDVNFLRYFPEHSGFSYFLIETDRPDETAAALERGLRDFGMDAVTTTQKLAHFHAVENTYLSTFQTLGGLGLLLGTLGLGVVMVRNAVERRGELATLRAFGFRRRTLARMLVAENGFLMAVGLAMGTAAALIAVAPHIIAQGETVPWSGLGMTLAAVYVTGIVASIAAVGIVMRMPLMEGLKGEA